MRLYHNLRKIEPWTATNKTTIQRIMRPLINQTLGRLSKIPRSLTNIIEVHIPLKRQTEDGNMKAKGSKTVSFVNLHKFWQTLLHNSYFDLLQKY
jgi:hypothetical protein